MIITYGWSHPDGNIPGNAYGKFLDSLKCTEKYGVVNSSFSFDDVGQVKISLKLSLKGSTQVQLTKISEGEGVKEALQEVRETHDRGKEGLRRGGGGRRGRRCVPRGGRPERPRGTRGGG